MSRPVLVLMLCLFSVGSAEFVIAGILPGIAADLDVSLPAAGLLVSGYAVAVMIGGPLITLATTRVPRKPLMATLMAVFTASNVVAAAAPDYGVLMAARMLGALTHCTFFALCIVVAVRLVPEDRQGAAIAHLAIGLNLANILGVPLGTLVGSEYGWRATFWTVALCGAAATLLLLVAIPSVRGDVRAGALAELKVLGVRRVQMAVVMSALGCAGVFTAYTFISPVLTEVSGFSPGAVTWLLLLFGLGTFAGSLLGGRLTDRALMPSLSGLLGVLTVVLAAFALAVSVGWAAVGGVLVFGAAFGAILPGLQARILQSTGSGAPTLAVAVNISAMNIGIAFGAWLGGAVLDGGRGLRTVIVAGAAVALLGFLVSLRELARDRAGSPAAPRGAAQTPAP
ncbi:MFS transporter [Thermobifida halotolerans]|uniref:MFS transporter n=1 Tax=Thermobifida halotolerans TaxID=483545 RepID=A0A399FZE4_9ACTN|nr:MFS transporter [Thermobifida halotolerans]UOE18655.1 MFS transporter [Thermobifida halotolerans]